MTVVYHHLVEIKLIQYNGIPHIRLACVKEIELRTDVASFRRFVQTLERNGGSASEGGRDTIDDRLPQGTTPGNSGRMRYTTSARINQQEGRG